jgi:hypothetical protein
MSELIEKAAPIYNPPTREAVVKSMYSDGLYIGVCRQCKQKIRGKNIDELKQHKCDGKIRI